LGLNGFVSAHDWLAAQTILGRPIATAPIMSAMARTRSSRFMRAMAAALLLTNVFLLFSGR